MKKLLKIIILVIILILIINYYVIISTKKDIYTIDNLNIIIKQDIRLICFKYLVFIFIVIVYS